MLTSLLPGILKMLFPKMPAWLIQTLVALFDAVMAMVNAAQASKLSFADWADQIEEVFDEALDEVPGWGRLTEDERDTVLQGMSILVSWIYDLSAQRGTPNKVLRKSFKRAGRTLGARLRRIEAGQ